MSLFIEIINRATAFALQLDPQGNQKFKPLQGKTFCLRLTDPSLTLYLKVVADGLEISTELEPESDSQSEAKNEAQVDVTLSGAAMDFIRLGMSDDEVTNLVSHAIHIEGDAETGQKLQRALSQIDFDWEELLARFIGDTPARKSGNLMRGLRARAVESGELCRENFADYLVEEKRVLVSHAAMQKFARANNQLRGNVDRIEQHIAKLESRINRRRDDA